MNRLIMVRIKKSKIRASIIFFISLLIISCSLFLVFRFFSSWNGRDPLNIVISSSENLWILSFRPDDKQVIQISIPPTVIIEVPGRGKWQARALWDISQLENDPSLVAAAGWNLLEIPVDTVLRFPNWNGREISFISLFSSHWKDLAYKFRLIKFLKSLTPTQIRQIDLLDLGFSRRVVDPGGVELVETNPDLLSPPVEELFLLDSLRQEGLTVAIRNSSARSGAGALLSRQLEHVGFRVVFVADGTGERLLTIKNKQLRKTLSVRKLVSWLDTKPVVADFPERADILVVVK